MFSVPADIRQVCDPALFDLDEAIAEARLCDVAAPQFELRLVKFLQGHRLETPVPAPTVLRGLEVLSGILSPCLNEETRLVTLLRPFLKSNNLDIASKCALILGREDRGMQWLKEVMEKTERSRANLVESLWPRKEREVDRLLQSALLDPHQRVAANAVYGLYLRNHDTWVAALNGLVGSSDPAFRRSGVWLLKLTAQPDAPSRLLPLIRDTDAHVRKAAFDALKHLRRGPSAA
jgi:hypothetical protein